MLELQGNILFTEKQIAYLKAAYVAEEVNLPWLLPGFPNDMAAIKKATQAFRDDPTVGRWDHFYNGSDSIPNEGFHSKSQPYNKPGQENIGCAALVAMLTEDKGLAFLVQNELIWMAENDDLDASNGGSTRRLYEPLRPNKKHGKANRFDRSVADFSNPLFFSAARITEFVFFQAMIWDLVKEMAYYKINAQKVFWWFKDWTDFSVTRVNNRVQKFLRPIDKTRNWYEASKFEEGATPDDDIKYGYYDKDLNGQNKVMNAQIQTVNNRNWEAYCLAGVFGYAFENKNFSYRNFAHSCFYKTIMIGVYSDGTFHEWYRTNNDKKTAEKNQNVGLQYTLATLLSMTILAHVNEVCTSRGLKSGALKGAFYNYQTAAGTDELYPKGYRGTSTSGGDKSLLNAILNVGKYFKEPKDGGYIGERFDINGKPIDVTDMNVSIVASIANLYYQNQELQDLIVFDKKKGYKAPEKIQTNFHSYGKVTAIGGYTAFSHRIIEPFKIET